MKKVLFVCVHNSARSQMAEAYLNQLSENCKAESAGLTPGTLNNYVVRVLAEQNIDISNRQPQGAFDYFKQGRSYDYVITVCDEANGEKCPIFPGITERLHWNFPDPSQFQGSDEEIMNQVRELSFRIKERVRLFLEERKLAR